MSRAIFMSACGDPFLPLLSLKLWKERWYEEVDEFYIDYNNHCGVPQNVVSEFLSRVSSDKKVHVIYHPRGIGNGMPITDMTLVSKADNIMLLEDDGFVFEGGIIDECFKKIESDSCDVVGSPRGSCGNEVWEASKIKYALNYSGYGDVGPNWWPNFFFCKRKDLLRTDLNFASKKFGKGEYFKELDYTFKEDNYGDTFVWACVQLRAMGLRSISVPQHKAGPFEIYDKQKKEQNWHPDLQPFKWIHGGSLSSGWGGYLSGSIPEATDDSSIQEMESRCAFWIIAHQHVEGFDTFQEEYKKGIELLIQNAHLDASRIQKKINIYKDLMKL